MSEISNIKLFQIITGAKTLAAGQRNTYNWAADEAGNMLARLVSKSEGKLIAPKPAQTGASRNVYYLKNIEESLKSFQSLFGLTASGQLDSVTAKKLKEVYLTVIRDGQDFKSLGKEAPPEPEREEPESDKTEKIPEVEAPPEQESPVGESVGIPVEKIKAGIKYLPQADALEYLTLSIDSLDGKGGTIGLTQVIPYGKFRNQIIFDTPVTLDIEDLRKYPPEYTIAHEFAHVLTFQKWINDPRLKDLLDIYEGVLSRGKKSEFPTEYAYSFVDKIGQAVGKSKEAVKITGFLEYLAEVYAQRLLFKDQIEKDKEINSRVLSLIDEFIAEGGNRLAFPPADLYPEYLRAITGTS